MQNGMTAMVAERLDRMRLVIGKIFQGFRVRNSTVHESFLRVEEKLVLGPKKTLYLVHCKGRDLVVAAGADSIVSVMELASISTNAAKMQPRLQKQARPS